jgi:1,4-alpha-glucan branching enzyme
MSFFAGAMRASGSGKVVYNDSHDEAGNSPGSARTICLAVNNAPLIGATRIWAEARVRVAAGLALLSAGTPMFFMGEEVGRARAVPVQRLSCPSRRSRRLEYRHRPIPVRVLSRSHRPQPRDAVDPLAQHRPFPCR